MAGNGGAVSCTGDLEGAKEAYTKSRPEYEQIEVLAGSFEDIDSDIDARAYAFDNGEAVEGVEDPVERGAHFQVRDQACRITPNRVA